MEKKRPIHIEALDTLEKFCVTTGIDELIDAESLDAEILYVFGALHKVYAISSADDRSQRYLSLQQHGQHGAHHRQVVFEWRPVLLSP